MKMMLSNNKYKSLVVDIIIFIIGTVLAKSIQFFLMPLYTTYMSPEAYGIAELTNTLAEFFYPLVTLCIYEGAFRFAVDPDYDNSTVATATAKVLIVSLGGGFILACILKVCFHYENSFLLFFVLYTYSFRMCMAFYVRGTGKSVAFAISGLVNALALGVYNYIFLVYLNMGVSGYLYSIGMGYLTSAVYLLIFGSVIKDINMGANVKRELNDLLHYCCPLIIYNVLYWFTAISGRYILAYYMDASAAGKYVAAIKIAAVVNMIQQAVYAAIQLNTSRQYTEDNKKQYYTEVTNFFCVFIAFLER